MWFLVKTLVRFSEGSICKLVAEVEINSWPLLADFGHFFPFGICPVKFCYNRTKIQILHALSGPAIEK